MKKQRMYFVSKKAVLLSIILFAFVFMNSCQKDAGMTDLENQEEQANPGVYSNAKKIGEIGESQTKEAPCAPVIYISSPVNNRIYEFDNVPVSFNQIGYTVTVNYLRYPAFVNISVDGTTLNNFTYLPSGNWTLWNDNTTTNVLLSEGGHTFTVSASNPGCSSEKSVNFIVRKRDFNVSISGPTHICYPNKGESLLTATWCANVNPSGSCTYQWFRTIGSGSEYAIGCTSSCYSRTYGFMGYNQSSTVVYRVAVTRNGVTKSAYITVYEHSKDIICDEMF